MLGCPRKGIVEPRAAGGVLLAVALFPCSSLAQGNVSDVAAAADVLNEVSRANRLVSGCEITFVVARALSPEVEPLAAESEQMTRVQHPETGVELRHYETWRIVLDSELANELNMIRNLQFVGTPERYTETHLMTPEYNFDVPPGERSGALARGDKSKQWDYATVRGWRDKQHTWPARSESLCSPPKRVKYLVFVLSNAGDVAVEQVNGRGVVRSLEWNSWLAIGERPGEVAACQIAMPRNVVYGYRVVEWQATGLTAARQPRIEEVTVDRNGTRVSVLRYYDQWKSINTESSRVFEWQTYADEAFDERDQRVIRGDGSVDAARTASRVAESEALIGASRKQSENSKSQGGERRTSIDRWLLAVGVGLIVVAAVIAVRRRVS